MKILSKQYEALVTAWKYNEFFKARIKLALLYVSMVACILAVFSGFLLNGLNQQIKIEREITESSEQYQIISDTFFQEFYENLLMTDFFILLGAGFLSFFLAGRTLLPIQKTLKQHEEFSSNVAHELRTPLAALYASTSAALRAPGTSAEYVETLTDFKHETKRLIDLTEQLLKTTCESTSVSFERIPVDIIAKQAVQRMHALAESHSISLSLVSEPLFIRGNATSIEELFSNLIHNAIKFSHPDGVVKIEVRGDGIVQIIDSGVGISKENLAHIFERFYTSNVSRNEQGERGTGLGLSIVSRIMRMHNATIDVASTLGSGTTCTLHFEAVS